MKIPQEWNDFKEEKYKPISDNYICVGFGTDKEPDSSYCLSSFAHAMKDNWKEGMKVLDYGCGKARLCNFMSKRLKDFAYYGVEPSNSATKHSENAIEYANEQFGMDKRINLGFIGEEVEKEAIETVDTVLLLSIFTHTSIESTEKILKKLLPVVERGGVIVFSMLMSEEYNLLGPNAYGYENSYGVVRNTEQQIEDIAKTLNVDISLSNIFLAEGDFEHSIYRVVKK